MAKKHFPDIPEKETVIVENAINWSIIAEEIDWESGEVLTLPKGVRIKILNKNDEEGRLDVFIKFPPGYIEPAHSHEAAHATILIAGRMLIHGHELTPGDYVYGQKELHGPMEYPDGCIVFASFVGGSPAHHWDEDPNV